MDDVDTAGVTEHGCCWCGDRSGPFQMVCGGLEEACSRVGECRDRQPDAQFCAYRDPQRGYRCHRPAGHVRADPWSEHYDEGRMESWY